MLHRWWSFVFFFFCQFWPSKLCSNFYLPTLWGEGQKKQPFWHLTQFPHFLRTLKKRWKSIHGVLVARIVAAALCFIDEYFTKIWREPEVIAFSNCLVLVHIVLMLPPKPFKKISSLQPFWSLQHGKCGTDSYLNKATIQHKSFCKNVPHCSCCFWTRETVECSLLQSNFFDDINKS